MSYNAGNPAPGSASGYFGPGPDYSSYRSGESNESSDMTPRRRGLVFGVAFVALSAIGLLGYEAYRYNEADKAPHYSEEELAAAAPDARVPIVPEQIATRNGNDLLETADQGANIFGAAATDLVNYWLATGDETVLEGFSQTARDGMIGMRNQHLLSMQPDDEVAPYWVETIENIDGVESHMFAPEYGIYWAYPYASADPQPSGLQVSVSVYEDGRQEISSISFTMGEIGPGN